jgi:hypothetical protein
MKKPKRKEVEKGSWKRDQKSPPLKQVLGKEKSMGDAHTGQAHAGLPSMMETIQVSSNPAESRKGGASPNKLVEHW